jgi:HK97 family phage prohead protease
MERKYMKAELASVDDAEGIVEAYVNTMGVNDLDGDVVESTAFDQSIRDNLPIPVLSGHDQDKLVGKVIFAQPEHVEGDVYKLFTRMKMNMETEAGRDAFSNVKGNFIREWSVGFNIPKDTDVEHEGTDVSNVLRRISNLDWVEVSTVIRGASPSTSTISAKSADQSTELDSNEVAPETAGSTDEGTTDFDLIARRRLELTKARIELNKSSNKE